MSKMVFKYEVPVDGEWHELRLPIPGRVVHVGCQRAAAVCFWAEVPSEGGTESSAFRVFGTGHEAPEDAEYVGTAQAPGGLVWHLYVRRNHGVIRMVLDSFEDGMISRKEFLESWDRAGHAAPGASS